MLILSFFFKTVGPYILKAYISTASFTFRRNCKGNPRCVNALGEGKWFQEIKDRYWYDIGDPNKEKRDPVRFSSLF